MYLSRRKFVELAAAAPLLARSIGAAVTAQEVADRIRKNIGVGWKPDTLTLMSNVPIGTSGNRYVPADVDTVSNLVPDFSSTACTLAPGTTAPVESLTVPAMLPNTVCALDRTVREKPVSNISNANPVPSLQEFISTP